MGKLEYTRVGLDFITARNEVMFSPVCVKNSVHGGRGCMAEGDMHGRDGHAWQGVCMTWEGGMHGGGHAWRGGGSAWQEKWQ